MAASTSSPLCTPTGLALYESSITVSQPPVRRQRGGNLVQRVPDALDAAEPLQVLWPDRREDGRGRVGQVAYGGDLPRRVRIHLDDEQAVLRREVLVDGAGHPHQGVEA